MQRTLCFLVSVLLIVFIGTVKSPLATADTILTYRGNPYTQATGPYTTSMYYTASIDLAAPLPDAAVDFKVTPVSFTLSDGIRTLTESTANLYQYFFFWTDASGDITNWYVDAARSQSGDFTGFFACTVSAQASTQAIGIPNYCGAVHGPEFGPQPFGGEQVVYQFSMFPTATTPPSQVAISNVPGIWTETTSVPEPWSLPFLIGPVFVAIVMLEKRMCQRGRQA